MAYSNQTGDPRYKSPSSAAFLSLLPGVGQVYVGYYHQGFVNIIVAGTVFTLLQNVNGSAPYFPLGVLFLIFFVLYSMIDAYRRAMLYNLTLDGVTDVELPDNISGSVLGKIQGSYLGGVALFVFGAVALSNTAFGFSLEWVQEWWPVVPIFFGAYLVYQAWKESQNGGADDTES